MFPDARPVHWSDRAATGIINASTVAWTDGAHPKLIVALRS
jgi:hypothetical protein